MPLFDLTFLRVDRAVTPTVIEALFLTVDWPVMPREGEGVDIIEDVEAQTVDSVGYGIDGHPLVHLGRVVLDERRHPDGALDAQEPAVELGGAPED